MEETKREVRLERERESARRRTLAAINSSIRIRVHGEAGAITLIELAFEG